MIGIAAVRDAARSRRARVSRRFESLEERRLLAVVPEGFTETTVAAQLSSPTALDIAPDGRVFVAQQNGVIRVIEDDVLLPQMFGQVAADGSGERGLQGITFDPHFEHNGFIYLYYTASQPQSHNVVSRVTALGNEMVPGSEEILFELPNLSTLGNPIWHMGGSIQVGPDEMLYVAIGDHQSSNLAQNMNSLMGKILRIGTDGSIPTDNPFYNSTTGDNRAIWALGLRNPFTTIFDPASDRFYINDVGQGSWEEVNAGASGRNFGWPTTEGNFNQAQFPNFTPPVHAYSHSVGCAITGGAFYSPVTQQFPSEYEGNYFFAEFCNGEIRMFDPDAPANVTTFLSDADFPIGIDVTPNGTMYYMERGVGAGGADGTNLGSVHKIEYTSNIPPSFSVHPNDKLVSVGYPATFTASASGTNPLSYQWQRRNAGAAEFVDIDGATNATYSIAVTTLADNGAEFRVVATNPIDFAISEAATLTVTTNVPPVATIDLPLEGLTYDAGDTINYAFTGEDAEDGALPSSSLTWWVDFHHDEHSHPFIAPSSGSSAGSFVIPNSGETSPDVWYRVHLVVTDSIGLQHETYRDVTPNLSEITLETNIPGIELLLDGQPQATPLSVSGVINVQRTLEAPAFATAGGQTYGFQGWADGETDRVRSFAFPDSPTTYAAIYAQVDVTYLSDLPFLGEPENGWGPLERDRSNGELEADDGNPITLNGKVYPKGLGVHALSIVEFDLAGGGYSSFISDIGVDDEMGAGGSVEFEVWTDGVRVFQSGVMTGDSATQSISIDVRRKTTLRLVVTTAGNGNGQDHADWADAKLVGQVPVIAPPEAPQSLSTVPRGKEVVELEWVDAADNESGFQLERRDTLGDEWTVVATLPPNAESYLDQAVDGSREYEYRILAFNTLGDSPYSSAALVRTLPIDLAQINFQPAGTPGYFEYVADTGLPFGDRGAGESFGWNADNSAATRDRNSDAAPDQRYDTLTHTQKPENPNASWEFAFNRDLDVLVHAAGGDPSFFDGRFHLLAEGETLYDFTPSAGDPWAEAGAYVRVEDGRLTISNGPNAQNNKLSFIDLNPVPLVLPPVQGDGGAFSAVFEFNEPVLNFDLEDVVLLKDGVPIPFDGAQTLVTTDRQTWQLTGLESLVVGAGSFSLFIDAANSGIEDFGGALMLDDVVRPLQCRVLGDTDGNCIVDLSDLNAVRNNFGGEGEGDADFDGDVDLKDLNAVRNNFGFGAGAPGTVTTEIGKSFSPTNAASARLADAVFAQWTANRAEIDGLFTMPSWTKSRRRNVFRA
jgi:glucose/arabinose dehydrogenase